MPSAFIRTERRYRAMPLVGQLVDERFVLPGPLVLGKSLLRFLRPRQIGDRHIVLHEILPKIFTVYYF